MSDTQRQLELQYRKLLVDSYSSQLTTHARLIIGFAIILLTLLGVRPNLKQPISEMQLGILYFAIFLAAFGLWFLFMRHLMYGLLVHSATFASPTGEGDLYDQILNNTRERTLKKRILVVIPSCLFYSTGKKRSWLNRLFGLILCIGLALLTTYLVWELIG